MYIQNSHSTQNKPLLLNYYKKFINSSKVVAFQSIPYFNSGASVRAAEPLTHSKWEPVYARICGHDASVRRTSAVQTLEVGVKNL